MHSLSSLYIFNKFCSLTSVPSKTSDTEFYQNRISLSHFFLSLFRLNINVPIVPFTITFLSSHFNLDSQHKRKDISLKTETLVTLNIN